MAADAILKVTKNVISQQRCDRSSRNLSQCKDAAYCYRCSVVCICLLYATMSFVKTVELIEMPFELWTRRVSSRNHRVSAKKADVIVCGV